MAVVPKDFTPRDFTPDEFIAGVHRRCFDVFVGQVKYEDAGLTDASIARLVEGVLRAVAECTIPPITEVELSGNAFGDIGLGHLAHLLGELKTVLRLNIDGNPQITTLTPLLAAGVLENLEVLHVGGCTLSGDILPAELCANMPALKCISVYENKGGGTVTDTATLTAGGLCALPAECVVIMCGTKVKVEGHGAVDPVTLPTGEGDEFGGLCIGKMFESVEHATAEDICDFAGVQRFAMVKPARTGDIYRRE